MPDARTDARDDAPDRLQSGPLAVNEPIDLTGRTALVTGAASGIGASVARALAGAGATVHAVDRDADGLAALADGSGIATITADLAALDDLANLPTEVDILVNNAGIQHVSPIEEFPVDRFEFILDLMLVSPFRLIRQSLPHMYDRGWGRIVNISSVHGLRASAFKSAYVTAKHGLEGLSKVVALEGGPRGVTSTCINPAYVRTPLVERQIADQARTHGIPESEVVEKVMLAPVSVKRLVEPDEVAALTLFLCGPASGSINGTSFSMDGGWTAH
jgi:3-hydroxybutyrate dehydrogenase